MLPSRQPGPVLNAVVLQGDDEGCRGQIEPAVGVQDVVANDGFVHRVE